MRVLLGHNYYRSSSPSGEDAVFRNEWAMLEKMGIEVIPCERFNDDIDESSMAKNFAMAVGSAWSMSTYDSVAQLVRVSRPDLAHFHNTFPLISPSAYAACRDLGVPVIQTLHNYRLVCPGALLRRSNLPCEDCVGVSLVPAMRHRCYRGSLAATGAVVWMLTFNRWRKTYERLVNRYIALTEFAAKLVVRGGLPAARVVVKPNFLPEPPPSGPGGGGYAVYVGRLSEEKGIRTLFAAWRLVKGLPLKVLGDGPLRPELVALARRQNLPIEFLGLCGKEIVLETVGRAELQLIPSEWYEGFPMVALEAFACGTPVVASSLGSLAEILNGGETGMLFKPGNAEELAHVVNRLMCNPAILLDLREKGRAEFEQKYTAEGNFEKLMKIYQDAIREAGNGSKRC